MSSPDIPPLAITAAVEALLDAAVINNAGYLPGDEELAARLVLAAAAPHLAAAERERLFVAIRHAISLDKPWRGEALDVIDGVWREQP